MVRGAFAACIVLLSSALAGCAVLDGGDARSGNLVRIVTLDFDPEAFGEDINDAADVFAALADTRFEYTHDDAAMDAADITVEFTDEAGREREVPLSDFTQAASVGRGDKITIEDVLLTSPVEIRHGGDTLASRGGRAIDWLEAGGYPLPLAMNGGKAVWTVNGDLALDAAMDTLEIVEEGTETDYVCTPSGQSGGQVTEDCEFQETAFRTSTLVQDGAAQATADLDATITLDAVGSALQPALELGLEGTWAIAALFGVHVTQESTREYDEEYDADFGFDLDLTATGDGAVTLRFERNGSLRAAGAEGDLDVEGDLVMWDDEHARSDGFSPGGLDDIDFHAPYDEEDVGLHDNPVAFVAQALADLWRMDLAPGDEFHLSTGDRFGDEMPVMSITIRVISEGDKTVPAGTFEALRIETSSVLEVPVEGAAAERFELPTLTTWIDSKSGVPVAVQQSLDYDYDQEDFGPLFDVAGGFQDGLTVTPPTTLHIGLDGTTLAELEEWDDGLRMAPMASVLLPVLTFASPFASAMVFPLLGGFADEDDYYEGERAPDIAFTTDETSDRITIIMAQSDLTYGDFDFRASQDVHFAHNAAATSQSALVGTTYQSMTNEPWQDLVAGDFVDFCGTAASGPTTFTILHIWSNTVVYETTMNGIAAC